MKRHPVMHFALIPILVSVNICIVACSGAEHKAAAVQNRKDDSTDAPQKSEQISMGSDYPPACAHLFAASEARLPPSIKPETICEIVAAHMNDPVEDISVDVALSQHSIEIRDLLFIIPEIEDYLCIEYPYGIGNPSDAKGSKETILNVEMTPRQLAELAEGAQKKECGSSLFAINKNREMARTECKRLRPIPSDATCIQKNFDQWGPLFRRKCEEPNYGR